jgi:hypothetical protein
MDKRPIMTNYRSIVIIVIISAGFINPQLSNIRGQSFHYTNRNSSNSFISNQVFTDSLTSNEISIEKNLQDSSFYFYEPFPIKPGNTILQLGGSFTLLPLPVVENEYPAPALDIQYKRGLWQNIVLDVSFSTNYFSNLFHAGIQWNFNIDRLSIGIGDHIGGFYGFINTAGQFDQNSATAFFDLPIIRFGYRFKRYSVSMSWAASYIFASYNKVSGLKAEGPQGKVNDVFCTLALEQPFLKHSLLSIGFSLNYARSPYQSWMLYNTLDEYLFLPEFFFAFQL